MSRHGYGSALAATLFAVAVAVSGCSTDSGSTAAFCAQVKKVPSLEAVLSRFSETDSEVLSERIDKARQSYDALASSAPSEIDEETEDVVDLVNETLDAVEQNPNDPTKASAQLRAAMAEHKGVADERAKVAAFAQATCDVQLDPTLTDGATTTTSPSASTTETTQTTVAD